MGRIYLIVKGTAIKIPSCANHKIHVPAKEFPARDKKEIGLNSVAKIETDVTHHGMVPSPRKNSLPFISFLEKARPTSRTASRYTTRTTMSIHVKPFILPASFSRIGQSQYESFPKSLSLYPVPDALPLPEERGQNRCPARSDEEFP